MEVESQVHLYGHTAEVTGLFVCKPYSILISVSRDGTCILWDLNRFVLSEITFTINLEESSKCIGKMCMNPVYYIYAFTQYDGGKSNLANDICNMRRQYS